MAISLETDTCVLSNRSLSFSEISGLGACTSIDCTRAHSHKHFLPSQSQCMLKNMKMSEMGTELAC